MQHRDVQRADRRNSQQVRRGIFRSEVVVIALVALLLLGILIPLILQTRSQSRQADQADRLRKIYGDFSAYHDTYGSFPASGSSRQTQNPRTKTE